MSGGGNGIGVSDDPVRGITLKVLSVAVFVAMSTLAKVSGEVPPGQIVFFRCFFAIFPILAYLAWRREFRTAFYTSRPLGHLARGMVGVIGMGCGFFALTKLPLPEAITLNYAQPLVAVVFSAIFLHETIRVYRWTAVFVGFIGVVIVAWPNLTLLSTGMSDDAAIGAIVALIGAAVSAVAMLLIRRLLLTERSGTIVFYASATGALCALMTWFLGWISLAPWQVAVLVATGVLGGIGQILMTESYRHAEASTIAPFEYTSLILSIVIGFMVFGDIPTLYTIVGGTIIISAGVFIVWREHKLGLERTKARKLSAPN
jgi:drug/metabolite transporter (DMT)-like permease